jgi:hypothetical protein
MTNTANKFLSSSLLILLSGVVACDMDMAAPDELEDDIGETSEELYDPANPPAAVATDMCDESTFADTTWSSQSSAHFVAYYLPGTEAERDVASILSRREIAYASIRSALGLTVEPTISIYLSPNRLAAIAKGKGLGTAFPGSDRIEAVYTGAPNSFEVQRTGNLMTRALEYHLDSANRRRIPILSVGLAEHLDQSGRSLHDAYALQLISGAETRTRMGGFEAGDLTGRNTGRAGSLVKFLIDRYGMTGFLDVFKATKITSVSGCTMKSAAFGCINSAAALTNLLDGALKATKGESWATVGAAWKAAVKGRMAKVVVNLPAADVAAITNLVDLMDEAIVTADPAIYRSTMEGYYCEWGGEANRNDIATRTIDAHKGSKSSVLRIYPGQMGNFSTATVLMRRNDERSMLSVHTLTAEKFPAGWRITYGTDWW